MAGLESSIKAASVESKETLMQMRPSTNHKAIT